MKPSVPSLQAPFPWFGGKRRVASLVWERFGEVKNFVEPFFGSGAVLLNRPGVDLDALPTETANDKDGFVANAWRSIMLRPDETAAWADGPVFENDLHARHVWLRERREALARRLEADPEYCDPKVAGWWVWGVSVWIGGGFCGDRSAGPWRVVEDGKGVGRLERAGAEGTGVKREMPSLSRGRGVQRKMPNMVSHGVSRNRPHLGNDGHGVQRQMMPLGDAGQGVQRRRVHLHFPHGVARPVSVLNWFRALSERLRRVRVACGGWSRVCGPSVTWKLGLTGVFLDPPYSGHVGRDMELYAEESGDVAAEAREWAIENGDNPRLRIALCGYEGEHDMPEAWECVAWKAHGGYASLSKGNGNGRCNAKRERIWFSPACLRPARQTRLFEEVAV